MSDIATIKRELAALKRSNVELINEVLVRCAALEKENQRLCEQLEKEATA